MKHLPGNLLDARSMSSTWRLSGPKPDASARQVLALTRDIARLRRKLERTELIIDAQKKLCVALGLPTSDDRTEEE